MATGKSAFSTVGLALMKYRQSDDEGQFSSSVVYFCGG